MISHKKMTSRREEVAKSRKSTQKSSRSLSPVKVPSNSSMANKSSAKDEPFSSGSGTKKSSKKSIDDKDPTKSDLQKKQRKKSSSPKSKESKKTSNTEPRRRKSEDIKSSEMDDEAQDANNGFKPLDESEREQIGHKISMIKVIGEGAYGRVFKSLDEYKTPLAVKEIKTNADQGIPCLMETSIMSSLSHPHLHRAIRCHATAQFLYIISDLAISDLSKHIKKEGNIPDYEILRYWSHSLLQAVNFLHQKDIIHCDIKASNILLFPNHVVKLADFTIATKKYDDKTISRNRTVCTSTHRPLEVWLQRNWDTSLDVWSLGCTLYETAVAELLFPIQQGINTDRDQYLNCILDWHNITAYLLPSEDSSKKSSIINAISKKDLFYSSLNLNNSFFRFYPDIMLNDIRKRSSAKPSKKPDIIIDKRFCDLILKMLRIDPLKRPTAAELLIDDYFRIDEYTNSIEINNTSLPKENFIYRDKKLTNHPSAIITTPSTTMTADEIKKCSASLSKYCKSPCIINLSIELFSRCMGAERFTHDHPKLMACLWIASKLILTEPISSDIPLAEILRLERAICTYLSFRLHASSNAIKFDVEYNLL